MFSGRADGRHLRRLPGAAPLSRGRRCVDQEAVQGCGGTLLDDGVVAEAAVEDVLPGAADEHVVPRIAAQGVVALAADQDVVTLVAIGGELDAARRQARRLDDVVAGESIDDDPVVGGLEPGDVYRVVPNGDRYPVGVTGDNNHVVTARGIDGDGVRRIVAGRPADRAGEIYVDLRHVCPAQVVDNDIVDAAKGIEVDVLDVVEVHGDVCDVAEEGGALAVGRDIDILGDGGAVEQERVHAVLTFDRIVVITRVPDECVIARSHESDVVAVAAVDQVVALAAAEQVGAATAVHRQLDGVSLEAARVDHVVAVEPVHRQAIIRLLWGEDVHRRRQAVDRHPSGVAGDDDVVAGSGIRAGHGDGIRRSIAAAVGTSQVDVDLSHIRPAEIADHDFVGAAERAEVDVLDLVEVHADGRDVAEEQGAAAIGRDADLLIDVGAEEQHGVRAVLAFHGVVAVARIPLEHIVPSSELRAIVAVVAEDEILAVAAEQEVVTLAAEDGVVAGAAVDGQLDDPGWQRGGGDAVVAAQSLDDETVVGRFAVGHVGPCRQSEDRDRASRSDHIDDVAALGAGDGHRVGCAVAGGPTDRAGEIDVDLRHVGPAEIVDSDSVGAAQRVDVDSLDIIEVHDDAAEIAREAGTCAIGRDFEDLVTGTAVEQHRIGAVSALDLIAAVAWIPLEGVIARAEEGAVVALLAVDEIVAVAAEEGIGAVSTENGVVAGAAVDGHADEARKVARGAEAVIAAVHVEDEVFGRADIDAEGAGRDSVEPHARTVGGEGEGLVAVAAIDLGGIDAIAALEQIGVIARIPDHAVVASLAEDLIVAIAAGQHVIAGPTEEEVVSTLAEESVVATLAEEHISARAAGQRVVAGTPKQVGSRQRAVRLIKRDHVVTPLTKHLYQAGIGDRWSAALHRNGTTVDENVARRIAAECDRIVQIVAEHREHLGDRRKARCHSHSPAPVGSLVHRRCALAAYGLS